MNPFQIWTASATETSALAEALAAKLQPGDLIALEGDLGAGKTTFTKGLAKGLGINRHVNSPTFTIMKEYEGRLPLYHMDVYRLADAADDLGFEEYFESQGVTVIEWAQYIAHLLPSDYLMIEISYEGEEKRKFTFTPKGLRYIQLCEELNGA